MTDAGWTRERTADGSPTLVNASHGEACHNRIGAWLESRERYAAACALRERATGGGAVRLLDVGTGLGLNLAAALEAVASAGGTLRAVTFELDEGVLDAAARWCAEEAAGGGATGSTATDGAPGTDAADASTGYRPWWGAVQEALAAARASGGEVALAGRHRLRLALGDAREEVARLDAAERFDACFFDPFSAASDDVLWGTDFLLAVAARLAPGGVLSTYSERADARLAWTAAGLHVTEGDPLGAKRAGTIARRLVEGAPPPAAPGPRLAALLARRLPAWCAERGLPLPAGWPPEGPKIAPFGSKAGGAALE